MKIAIAIILVILTFNVMVLWSCCRVASKVDQMEKQEDSKG